MNSLTFKARTAVYVCAADHVFFYRHGGSGVLIPPYAEVEDGSPQESVPKALAHFPFLKAANLVVTNRHEQTVRGLLNVSEVGDIGPSALTFNFAAVMPSGFDIATPQALGIWIPSRDLLRVRTRGRTLDLPSKPIAEHGLWALWALSGRANSA